MLKCQLERERVARAVEEDAASVYGYTGTLQANRELELKGAGGGVARALPQTCAMVLSGRWMPSKMLPMTRGLHSSTFQLNARRLIPCDGVLG
jgi:hypothetical protein